jgi:peroxiredoxin Q/BCP
MSKLWLLGGVLVLGGWAATALMQSPIELKEGDAAPNFALPGADGKTHRLSDYRGRAVVLAWFPKAFTGG